MDPTTESQPGPPPVPRLPPPLPPPPLPTVPQLDETLPPADSLNKVGTLFASFAGMGVLAWLLQTADRLDAWRFVGAGVEAGYAILLAVGIWRIRPLPGLPPGFHYRPRLLIIVLQAVLLPVLHAAAFSIRSQGMALVSWGSPVPILLVLTGLFRVSGPLFAIPVASVARRTAVLWVAVTVGSAGILTWMMLLG